jgi:uncharacterized protein YukE
MDNPISTTNRHMSELTDTFMQLIEEKFKGVIQKIDSQHEMVNKTLSTIKESTNETKSKVADLDKAITKMMISESRHYTDCPNTKLCYEIQKQIADDKLKEEKDNAIISAIKQNPRTAFILLSLSVAMWIYGGTDLVDKYLSRNDRGMQRIEQLEKNQGEYIKKEAESILGDGTTTQNK